MLTGKYHFKGETIEELIQNNIEDKIIFDESDFKNISLSAKKFIENFTEKNSILRPSASSCLNFPWISSLEETKNSSTMSSKTDNRPICE